MKTNFLITAVFVLLGFSTTGMLAYKLFVPSSTSIPASQVLANQDQSPSATATTSPSDSPSIIPTIIATLMPTKKPIIPTKYIPPTSIPTTPPNTNNNSNSCIVTINGQQYDLTSLSSSHPGPKGNTITSTSGFFQCGTDMTSIFNGQHGTKYSMLSKYLLASNTSGQTSNSNQNPTTFQNNQRDEDEQDDD